VTDNALLATICKCDLRLLLRLRMERQLVLPHKGGRNEVARGSAVDEEDSGMRADEPSQLDEAATGDGEQLENARR
jgi:hypothetical protein